MTKISDWFPVTIEYEHFGKIESHQKTLSMSGGFDFDVLMNEMTEIKRDYSKLSKIFRAEQKMHYEYGSEWLEWVVTCYREETDEEYNARKKEQEKNEDANREREMIEFLRLKEKFDKGLLND
jgi:hypothetical protein